MLMGGGSGSYSWTGPGGFTSSTETRGRHGGIYVLTVTGANGCTSTANALVGTWTCRATSLRRHLVMLMGTGNGSFLWTGPGGFTSSDQNPWSPRQAPTCSP